MSDVTVTTFDTWEEAQQEIARARRSADTRVKPWQSKVTVGDFVLTIAEGEPVFSEVLETYSEPEMMHYRFCRASSVWVEAELGDIHASQFLRVLTKAEYEEAKANEWRFPEPEGGRHE